MQQELNPLPRPPRSRSEVVGTAGVLVVIGIGIVGLVCVVVGKWLVGKAMRP